MIVRESKVVKPGGSIPITLPEASVVPVFVEPPLVSEFVVFVPLPPVAGSTIVAIEVVRLGYAIIDVDVERLEPGPVITVIEVEYVVPVPVIVVDDPIWLDPSDDDELEFGLDELELGKLDVLGVEFELGELEELDEPDVGEELAELLEEGKHPTG